MKTILKAIAAAALAVTAALAPVTASANAFYGWVITDVPDWDLLNVRAWPSSESQILVAYPNGVILSMTGKCTKGVDLGAIAGWPAWQQREAVRYAWCETYVDPYGNGNYTTAWVYGKYIAPAQ